MLHVRHGLNSIFKLRPCRPLIPIPYSHRYVRRYSNEEKPSHDIAVLGGGITGLASAYYLTKELPKARVTIYEASPRIGGWLTSKSVPVKDGTVLFEAGPRTLRTAGNGILACRLIQELDLTSDTIFTSNNTPAAKNRYVYYPDHLVRMPHPSFGFFNNLSSLWTEPVFETALRSGATEYWKEPRDPSVKDESIGDFFSRRLSSEMVDRILSALMHGIYAGDVYKLSARSLFPGPFRDELETGSVLGGFLKTRAEGLKVTEHEASFLQEMKEFKLDKSLRLMLMDTSVFTFKDGLGMLVDKMVRYLMENEKVEIRTGTPVQSIALSDEKSAMLVRPQAYNGSANAEAHSHTHVISALSPQHLNAVAQPADADRPGTSLVPEMPTVTVMTVNLYFRTPNLHPPGFGYLIPLATPFEQNPERALGVVFDTAYSPSAQEFTPQVLQAAADAPDFAVQPVEEQGGIQVSGFWWPNYPDKPPMQDTVPNRGTKVTVMLGGHHWDGWPAYPSKEEGLIMARSILERHLLIKEEPEAWEVNLQNDCIPQYHVGHEDRLKKAHNKLWSEYKGRVRVAGNWMSGVGVNDCLRSAWDVARSLREGKDGTGLEHVGAQDFVRLKIMMDRRSEQAGEEK